MPTRSSTTATRAQNRAEEVLEAAQTRLYASRTSHPFGEASVVAVADHLSWGDYGRALTELVDTVNDPGFTKGLARALIAYGHPVGELAHGVPSRYDSPFSPAGEIPGALMREGFAQMNAALGAPAGRRIGDNDALRLNPEDLWSRQFAQRVEAVAEVFTPRSAPAHEDLRVDTATPPAAPQPTLLERWTEGARRMRGGAAALTAVAVVGVVGGPAVVDALTTDEPEKRDLAAYEVDRQLELGSLPMLDHALEQVRTLAPGVADEHDDVSTEVATERLDQALSVAHRVLRSELDAYTRDTDVFHITQEPMLDVDGYLTFELNDDIVHGLVQVMAATDLNEVANVLNASPDELRARAAERGTSVLVEAGLTELGDVSEARGAVRVESAFASPGEVGALLEQPSLESLVQEMRDQFYAAAQRNGGVDASAMIDAVLIERATAQLATQADGAVLDWLSPNGDTFDRDRLTDAVEFGAILGVPPDLVVDGDLRAPIRDTSTGKTPASWAGTEAATKHLNDRLPHRPWSALNNGLASAGRVQEPSFGR